MSAIGVAGDDERATPDERFDIAVVIVTWNVWELACNCVQSLKDFHDGLRVQVIVVDNASEDETGTRLRARFPEISLIAADRNLGFPIGCNLGIAAANAEAILLLNPDTVVREGTLRGALGTLRGDPGIGVVGCRLVYPDGRVQMESARRLPALRDVFIETFYLHVLFPGSRMCGRHLMSYWDHQGDRDVECISGAFMLIREKMLNHVGALDTRFFMYYEDVEICARAWRAGWRVRYVSGPSVVHHSGASRGKTTIPFDFLTPEIQYQYFRDFRGRVSAETYRILAGLQGCVRLLVSAGVRVCGYPFGVRGTSRALRPSLHLGQLLWAIGIAQYRNLGRDISQVAGNRLEVES